VTSAAALDIPANHPGREAFHCLQQHVRPAYGYREGKTEICPLPRMNLWILCAATLHLF